MIKSNFYNIVMQHGSLGLVLCIPSKGELQVKVTFSSTHSLSPGRQGPSRCPGRVFPQVTIHGLPNSVQVPELRSSHRPALAAVRARCVSSWDGVPCWTQLGSPAPRSLSKMINTAHGNRVDRMWEFASSPGGGGWGRQWTPDGMPHRRQEASGSGSYPFGMASPGLYSYLGPP